MRVEVDQSGKIEQTSHDTVVAFSDDEEFAVLIPAKVKRELIAALRARRRLRRPYPFIFAAAVYELVKDHLDRLEQIVIDIEYQDRESAIKGKLLALIRRRNPGYPKDRISFARIGKKSAAHEKALATYRGETAPGRVLTTDALMQLLAE